MTLPSVGLSEQQGAAPGSEQQNAGAEAGRQGRQPADQQQREVKQQQELQPGRTALAEAEGQEPASEQQQVEPPAGEQAAQHDIADPPAEQEEQVQTESRRPRRSAAANWMRHLASEDFIVDEPLLKPRRSQQVGGLPLCQFVC